MDFYDKLIIFLVGFILTILLYGFAAVNTRIDKLEKFLNVYYVTDDYYTKI